MKCPICKKEVEFGAPEMPFCSERCRLIDLGMWADEAYRIPVVGQELSQSPAPSPDPEAEDE